MSCRQERKAETQTLGNLVLILTWDYINLSNQQAAQLLLAIKAVQLLLAIKAAQLLRTIKAVQTLHAMTN